MVPQWRVGPVVLPVHGVFVALGVLAATLRAPFCAVQAWPQLGRQRLSASARHLLPSAT